MTRFTLSDSTERAITLGRQLGSGGEARVYEVTSDRGLAAKIYHVPSASRAAKLAAMLATPPADPTAAQNHVSICWPTGLLFDGRRVNVGFLMPRVDYATHAPIFRLYNPSTRRRLSEQLTWQFLLRAATNVARAIDALHARGYVVGDLNQSNILVANTALATVIDCDSMQVEERRGGRSFRCPVGTPDYTPPELLDVEFRRTDRQPHHDSFSLAVLLFQLLMEGTHPFAGVWHAAGEPPPIQERIRAGAWPYADVPLSSPAPGAPPLDVLGPELRDLFRRCFRDGHVDPTRRPSPREWHRALKRAERALVRCQITMTTHLYGSHRAQCPWCERKRLLGGNDPFPSRTFSRSSRPAPQPVRAAAARTVAAARPAVPGRWPTAGVAVLPQAPRLKSSAIVWLVLAVPVVLLLVAVASREPALVSSPTMATGPASPLRLVQNDHGSAATDMRHPPTGAETLVELVSLAADVPTVRASHIETTRGEAVNSQPPIITFEERGEGPGSAHPVSTNEPSFVALHSWATPSVTVDETSGQSRAVADGPEVRVSAARPVEVGETSLFEPPWSTTSTPVVLTRAEALDSLSRESRSAWASVGALLDSGAETAYVRAAEQLRSTLVAIRSFERSSGADALTRSLWDGTTQRLSQVISACRAENLVQRARREPLVACPRRE